MECFSKRISKRQLYFAILLYIYRHLSDYTDFLPLTPMPLATGRIFVCKVQSSAVDAENFWDESRTVAVVPMTEIFLFLTAKRIPAKKFAP